MILVAAVAIGIAIMKGYSPERYTYPFTPITPVSWSIHLATVVPMWSYYMLPLPSALTLAVLLMGFRQPRPVLHRLMRQPGMVACCASVATLGFGALFLALEYHRPTWHEIAFEQTAYAMGCSVASAWIVLALTGRWRALPTWIDRSGRLLGVYWIAMIPVVYAPHSLA